MHSCKEITELASGYVDGELPWAEWAQFRVHILMCGPCRAYVEQIGVTVEALQELPETTENDRVKSELAGLFKAWAAENT